MMPELPINPLIEAAYKWRERTTPQEHRPHLGASLIGDECKRKLWYVFRHVQTPSFEGRVLRLFDTGNRAEARFVEELRGIGCEVWEVDPNTGKQIHIEQLGGHFSGSLDGIAKAKKGTPAYATMGGKPHVTEFKTHGDKSFTALEKDGVMKSKPLHFAQMQVYAHLMKIERWLYMAVNKNTDALYIERGETEHKCAEYMIDKAGVVITSQNPPEGISDNAAWYQCKFCDFNGSVCHGKKLPEVNCRTCLHSTPDIKTGGWHCSCHCCGIKEAEGMVCAGIDHLFIPDLVPLKQVNAGADYVEYEGGIKNGLPPLYTSSELQHVLDNPAVKDDANVNAIRNELGAQLVGAWQ